MKFTSILVTLVASLFLIDSTLALPAPKKCRAVCRAAKKVKTFAGTDAEKVLMGTAATALGVGGVYAAAQMANKAISAK
jgi:hypothetical protein